MSPISILIVADRFRPTGGGLAEYTHQVARHLHRRGDRVTVLSVPSAGADDFDRECGYEVLRADCPLTWLSPEVQVVGCLPEWSRVIGYVARTRKADCILSTTPFPMGLFCATAAHRMDIPYIAFVEGREVSMPSALAQRPIQKDYGLLRADSVICPCQYTLDRIHELGVAEERAVTILPGVDTEEFRPTRKGLEIRRQIGLNGHPMVLTLGRLVERKGVDRVIAGLKIVLNGIPNAVYVIAGTGPMERELRRQAQEIPELPDHVLFLGAVADQDRVDLYNACDIFAMPCRELADGDVEASGVTFLEANACGKPVVAGRSGGALDAVIDGYTGLFVDPWDRDDVAYALSMLLTDRDFARTLGENGRRRVNEQLTWAKVTERIRDEMVRVVEARRGSGGGDPRWREAIHLQGHDKGGSRLSYPT